MRLAILKMSKPVCMGEFEKIILPASEGEVEIMPGHTPFMSSLKKGKISFWVDGKREDIDIKKGFVEVNKLEVLVIL